MFVVTGATSNTGTTVANSLLDRGVPVRVIGRSRERLEPFSAACLAYSVHHVPGTYQGCNQTIGSAGGESSRYTTQ